MKPGRKISVNTASARADRKNYRARFERGVCAACPSQAVPGRRLCAVCAEKYNSRLKAFVADRIARGLCRECGWPSSRGTRCMTCRAKRRWLPNRIRDAPLRAARYRALRERAIP